MTISLTPTQEAKIKKLADEAGLPVQQMWKQVLKHGLPAIEDYFKGIRQAEADVKAGRVYTTEQVFAEIIKRRKNRA